MYIYMSSPSTVCNTNLGSLGLLTVYQIILKTFKIEFLKQKYDLEKFRDHNERNENLGEKTSWR